MNDHDSSNTTPGADQPVPEPAAGEPAAPDAAGPGVEFAEPELGAAEISADVADSVDLEAVAAEAAAVEREAERSTQLPAAEVIASIPEPTVQFGPVAQPPAGSEPDTPESAVPGPEAGEPPAGKGLPAPHIGRGIDDGSGWRRPETPWQQSATPWQPRANAWQSPGQVARGEADAAAAASAGEAGAAGAAGAAPAPGPAAPGRDVPAQGVPQQFGARPASPGAGPPGPPQGPDARQRPGGAGNERAGTRNKLLVVLGIAVVGVVLVVLLVWLLFGLLSGLGKSGTAGPAPVAPSGSQSTAATINGTLSAGAGSDAVIIAAQATPLAWRQGDCLKGFHGASMPADVVLCNSPHSAQLVATYSYPESDGYPGVEVLKARAKQVCQGVQLTQDAKIYPGLKELTAYPSDATWHNSHDRRVDCLVYDPAGENVKTTLIM
ncbi:hypothetical protein [Specibacter sp. RAF43]|uniref:hypothetical protein n=1 Tax=Specibacter sp. RAF43 TaxID=3233057 RepID=UPI003F975513